MVRTQCSASLPVLSRQLYQKQTRLLPSRVKPHPMKTIYTTVTLVASQRQKCCTDDIKNSSSINAGINVTSHPPQIRLYWDKVKCLSTAHQILSKRWGTTGNFTHTNHAGRVNQTPNYWGTVFSHPPPPFPPPPPIILNISHCMCNVYTYMRAK